MSEPTAGEVLEALRRDLENATKAMDVSSALTRQYVHAAQESLATLAAALSAPAEAGAVDWERIELPYVFSGGVVSIPALRDPQTGELFYTPDAAQIMYNLTHALTPAPDDA